MLYDIKWMKSTESAQQGATQVNGRTKAWAEIDRLDTGEHQMAINGPLNSVAGDDDPGKQLP